MDPNYRRRSQVEDEFVMFVLPTIEGSEKKPMHTSMLPGGMYVNEILTGHESLCKRQFRMEVDIFHALVRKLREKKLIGDSREVSLKEKVAIFLYAVAKYASNQTLQDRFQRSPETISRHFGVVLDAITKLTCIYVRPPSLQPHHILRKPHFYPYFIVRMYFHFFSQWFQV
uniref:Uncharacterized protein n=1 Tax=Avena sativa TaxID=4498 RepID=A0ACD5Z5J3_AVESA